ncbi:MAG: DUF3536 domain-containing protein [Acidimicrobiaceae bacterium]|nr:DUF3536 domain-containing protein [Acidimicrobiaceae bacterium]
MTPLAGFHFHFYQPPRENPWLGVIHNEWSAFPYHDWNERIAAECYRAMVAVAVEDETGSLELVEPLTMSSFNVAPTLHHWMENHAVDVEGALRHEMAERRDRGASPVMAMPAVHAILPLASSSDRRRLIEWGLADYRHRYGAEPTGMWLPETAVDEATLEALADAGVTYTVLMPAQARRVRRSGEEWRDVDSSSLDTTRAYRVNLGSGRHLRVVFGDAVLSQQVAFGHLIDDGVHLADQMAARAGEDGAALIVADGETYGHHHRFGDVGVAWALRRLRDTHHLETSLGEWLDTHDPVDEVELLPVSSWSCAHGVERWNSACGCVTGERPGFDLEWRRPLRQALDDLRHALVAPIESGLDGLVGDVDSVLTEYGQVLAGAQSPEDFLRARSGEISTDEVVTALELLEAYRHVLYSFTSCAWFFADPADIETSIVLRYAQVAVEMVASATGEDLTEWFTERLGPVRSALTGRSGRELWREAIESERADALLVGAGALAEHHVHGILSHRGRGHFSYRVEGSTVVVRDGRTTRQTEVTGEVTAHPSRGLSVRVESSGVQREFDLHQLGHDVVARVGAGWLRGPGSHDYEGALDALAAELLTRPGTRDDDALVMALACAPRCVSPSGEVALHRALVALVSHGLDAPRRGVLGPLGRAVGLSAMFPAAGAVDDFL